MTKEQAIETLNRIITTKFNNDYSIDNIDKEAIETVLNLIQKQKAEIEKKDKIIDKMTRKILIYQIKDSKLTEKMCNECGYEDCCEYISQDCIKQYYERKVENEN